MESNHRPPPYQGGALPTELRERKYFMQKIGPPVATFASQARSESGPAPARHFRVARWRILRQLHVPASLRVSMERETGIEPALVAWKATVLPLNYSRPGVLRFVLQLFE